MKRCLWGLVGLLLSVWGGLAQEDTLYPSGTLILNPNAVRPGTRTYHFPPVSFRLKEELRLGEEAAPAIEKEFGGVVEKGPQVERLKAVAGKVVAAAKRVGPPQVPIDIDPKNPKEPKELPITVKLLKSNMVNAFSVWGGRVYITQGLMEFVRTDDELAGIIGHELTHTMMHHLRAQERVRERAEQGQLLAVLAALLGGRQVNPAEVFVFLEWAKMEVVNRHSRRDEEEADRFGLLYAFEAGFNPAGLLTFMERLAHQSVSSPAIQLGAAQTHPWSGERAEALLRQLRELGFEDILPLKRRSARSLEVAVREGQQGEVKYAEVVVKVFEQEIGLVKLASAQGAESPLARAKAFGEQLQALFLAGLRGEHLYVQKATLSSYLSLQGPRPQTLLTLEPEDALLAGHPPEEAIRQVRRRLELAFSTERVATSY